MPPFQFLETADELLHRGDTMFEPHDLPGRYGRVISDLERLLSATETLAVVAGGWAVWRHGYVGRVTQDVDVVIPQDKQADLLRSGPICGFDALTVSCGNWPKLFHRETGIDVDLLPEAAFPGTVSRQAPVPIRHPAEYGAELGQLKYIPVEALFELKLGAHRAKDIADLVELIKVNSGQLQDIRDSLAAVHLQYVNEFDQLTAEAREEG
jgi:hypothetical protein